MLDTYISYFRSLAIRHKDLQHDPLSDSGQVGAASKHFTRFEYNEVVKGLRSTVGFPCLCLHLYENETDSQNNINVKFNPRGAFMVIDHPATDSFADEQAAYSKSERIAYEILQQIYQDHKPGSDPCARPFKKFDFDKINITPVGPVFTGEYGYLVEFNFELQKQINITNPPSPGTFLSP